MFSVVDMLRVPPRLLESGVGAGVGVTGTGEAMAAGTAVGLGVTVTVGGTDVAVGSGVAVGGGAAVAVGAVVGKGVGVGSTLWPQPVASTMIRQPRIADRTRAGLMPTPIPACSSSLTKRFEGVRMKRCPLQAGRLQP